jgi:hypothetical protein
MMKSRTFLQSILTIVLILTLSGQSFAGWPVENSDVHVDIITGKRGIIEQFDAKTQREDIGRSYVIAKHSEKYRIRISNLRNKRIGVVIAVDGRNIISGKKSHLKSHERMYILNPYQSQDFDGWRTGKDQINRFYFTNTSNSYASHWEDQTAMGVVAIAVFNEQHREIRRKTNGSPHQPVNGRIRGFSKSRSQRENPGTGFGEKEWSPSKEVYFAAQRKPLKKIFIKYEWAKTLCRMGVIQCRPKYQQHAKNHNRFWPHDRSHKRENRNSFAPFPSWLLPLGI